MVFLISQITKFSCFAKYSFFIMQNTVKLISLKYSFTGFKITVVVLTQSKTFCHVANYRFACFSIFSQAYFTECSFTGLQITVFLLSQNILLVYQWKTGIPLY